MGSDLSTGFLHPGAMGSTVGAACAGDCWWVSEGRSQASSIRAESSGLVDAGSVAELGQRVDLIVSVCPPSAAFQLAESVAQAGFEGIYVDANAVSPDQSRRIGGLFERFVDGGIVGPPATAAGTTRMYLAGSDAELVAQRWAGSVLDVRPIAGDVGAASALKMAYAGWTKGSASLLLAICALAQSHGVWDELQAEWEISLPDLPASAQRRANGVASKAWRFEGEMREIAATFDSVGLPAGFHEAAADVYRRLADLQHTDDVDLARVIDGIVADS